MAKTHALLAQEGRIVSELGGVRVPEAVPDLPLDPGTGLFLPLLHHGLTTVSARSAKRYSSKCWGLVKVPVGQVVSCETGTRRQGLESRKRKIVLQLKRVQQIRGKK